MLYFQTSPSDGTIVHFGRVANDRVEQIKGMTYSLGLFLSGSPLRSTSAALGGGTQSSMDHMYKMNPGRELYQCVIYLAPGDYHRFHSPTDWVINARRYFQGWYKKYVHDYLVKRFNFYLFLNGY